MEFLEALDVGTLYWFAPRHSPPLTAAMRALTHLGDGPVLGAFLLLIIAGFLWSGHWRPAFILAGTALVAFGLVQGCKYTVKRPRPDVSWDLIPPPHSPSFPSNHAAGAMLIYGSSALFIARRLQRRLLRRLLVAAALVLALAIGITRLYLGAHFLTDVLAGWSVGLAGALLAAWADRRWGDAAVVRTDPARGPFVV